VKLEGTIETIPLRELVDMIFYSSVTGSLNIYAPLVSGHLYFRDGNLYHCDCNESTGIEALARLFELSQASFSFVGDIVSDQETLWGDMEYHLRMSERLAQRWRAIRPQIASFDLVPTLVVSLEAALRRVGPSLHQLLDRIDGQHTLKAIIEDLGWAEIEVAEAVSQMVLDKLVELRHEVKAVNTSNTPSAGGPRGNLFDRMLSRSTDTVRQSTPEYPRVSAEEMVLRALRG